MNGGKSLRKFGIGEKNGKRLVDFIDLKGLHSINTFFEKKQQKSPMDRLKMKLIILLLIARRYIIIYQF